VAFIITFDQGNSLKKFHMYSNLEGINFYNKRCNLCNFKTPPHVISETLILWIVSVQTFCAFGKYIEFEYFFHFSIFNKSVLSNF